MTAGRSAMQTSQPSSASRRLGEASATGLAPGTSLISASERYAPDFPVKRRLNRAYRAELDAQLSAIHRRMKAGECMAAPAQIFEETHWLVNYTDRVEDIERRLADLRHNLDTVNGRLAGSQDPADGSFAPYFESWIWRLYRSVDPLKALARRGAKPAVALKLLEPVDTPEKLRAVMRGLLVSEAGGGHNKRKELNLAVSGLGQLLWRDDTASVFPQELDRAALAEALRGFVDDEWQDPETGYWGAWYRDGAQDGGDHGGEIRKTADLSITFHILSYRGGQVRHRERIAATTFAIRKLRYPYGWCDGGPFNSHHAYNVCRLLNLTWDELQPEQQAYASAWRLLMKLRALIAARDGRVFDTRPYTTVAEAYYFGISFLQESGLLDEVPLLDLRREGAEERSMIARIDRDLSALDARDAWVAAARDKLQAHLSR